MAVYGVDPQTGETVEVESEASLAALGYAPAGEAEIKQAQRDEARREKFSTTGQQVATAIEKAASALTFGGSTIVERGLLGISPEDIRAREEINPVAAGLGTAAGIVAPLALTGGAAAAPALGKAGVRAAAEMTAPVAIARLGRAAAGAAEQILPVTAESGIARQLAAKAITTGVGSAVEGAAYGLGQVVDEAALGDPNLTAQSALATIGLSTFLGAGTGALFSAGEVLVPAAVRNARDLIETGLSKADTGIQSLLRKKTPGQMTDWMIANRERLAAMEVRDPGIAEKLNAIGSPEIAERIANNWDKIIRDPDVRNKIVTDLADSLQREYEAIEAASKAANKTARPVEIRQLLDEQSKPISIPSRIEPADTYYHSSVDRDIELMDDYTTFLTPSRDAAKGYLQGKAGRIYEIKLPVTARIADERTLLDEAAKLGKKTQYPYQLVDDIDVQAELESQGYHGVSFRDVGPDNKYEHPTVALWKAETAGASIVDRSAPVPLETIPSPTVKAARQEYLRLHDAIASTRDRLVADPALYGDAAHYAAKLEGIRERMWKQYSAAMTPAEAFSALDEAKSLLSPMAKFGVVASDSVKDTVNLIKGLRSEFKVGLENPDIWGQAGARQAAFNAADSAQINASKEFRKQFMRKIQTPSGGVTYRIDPGKIDTYLNQTERARGAIRDDALDTWRKASSQYLDEIENSYRSAKLTDFDRKYFGDLVGKSEQLSTEARDIAAVTQLKNATSNRMVYGSYGAAPITQTAEGGAAAVGNIGLPELGTMAYFAHAAGVGSLPVGAGVYAAAKGIGKAIELVNDVPRAVVTLARFERAAQSVSQMIDRRVGKIISSKLVTPAVSMARSASIAAESAASASAIQAKYERRSENIRRLAGDPEALHRTLVTATEAFDEHAPNTTQSMTIASTRALTFLVSKLPEPPVNRGLWSQKWTPSQAEIAKFNRYYRAANLPLTILKDASRGTLTQEAVEAVSTIYPELMDRIRATALAKAASHTRPPPYRARMALAMLLGQDIDGTLSPASIQAAQTSHAAPSSKSPENQTGTAAPVKPSSTGLASVSLSNRNLTPMQKSAQRD